MKKVILNLAFLCSVLTCFGQSELWIYNESPDRLYIRVSYHEGAPTDCDVDAMPPAICLFPSTDYAYMVPSDYIVHSVRAFRANMGCSMSEVDWATDGHLIFPSFPCSPTEDDIPYDFTLTSCGGNCQKVLIE